MWLRKRIDPFSYFQKALHVHCLQTFTDEFGVKRKSGEEWLITMDDAETHIPDVYEEVCIVHICK